MAYNPFDFFRRNQKVFFAGLTILVMFMFVLSFGQGDFFSRFPQWLAKFQTHGEVMAKIDGSAVKESQLQDVSAERNLANGYMLQAAGKSLAAARTAAEKESDAANPDLRRDLSQAMGEVDTWLTRRLTPEGVSIARLDVQRVAGQLADREKNTPKAEDAKRVKAVRVYAEAVLGELARRSTGDKGETGVYFANQPNRTDRDRLEFLLWKKKADQLGIRYTHEDVARLVDAEFPSASITPDELKALADDVSAKAGRRMSDLLDALADEFRVRAAQTAVLGVGPVRDPSGRPAGTTQERYEHFVKETTATKYTFLTIPVSAYLSQVQGEPTDAELTKIFNDTSNTDPDPGSPRSGIREPRKVGVQWVEVSGSEDYFKKSAAARAAEFKKVQASVAAQALLGATLPPVGSAFGYDEYLQTQAAVINYRQRKTANPGRPVLSNFGRGMVGGGLMMDDTGYLFGQAPTADPQDALLDAELFRPELAAALAGLTAGGAATFAPVRAADVAVIESAFRESREKRLVAGVRAFHFSTLPGMASLADAPAGAVAAVAASPAPLSQAVVQTVLDRQTAENLRASVATEDVQAFEKELARIMKQVTDKSKADEKAKVRKEAADYVAKWIAERGLKTGGTAEPRSVHALADDPGLASLLTKDLLITDFAGKAKNSRAATAFGQAFVNEMDVQFGEGFRPVVRMRPVSGLYQPREYNPGQFRQNERQEYAPLPPGGFFGGRLQVTGGAPLTMVWRTDEADAVRPLSLTSDKAAREKCKAIWKMNKARELARKAADEAAETIKKGGANETSVAQYTDEALAQLKKPFAGTPAADRFQIYPSAPEFTAANLLVTPAFGVDTPPQVTPFLPTHRAVVYETEKMREDLLAHKDDPVGTTFVFSDQPQANLYLTVVAGREQKGDFMFREYVLYPAIRYPAGSGVLSTEEMAWRYATAARDADRKTAVSLLKAEFKYSDENPKLDEKKD